MKNYTKFIKEIELTNKEIIKLPEVSNKLAKVIAKK